MQLPIEKSSKYGEGKKKQAVSYVTSSGKIAQRIQEVGTKQKQPTTKSSIKIKAQNAESKAKGQQILQTLSQNNKKLISKVGMVEANVDGIRAKTPKGTDLFYVPFDENGEIRVNNGYHWSMQKVGNVKDFLTGKKSLEQAILKERNVDKVAKEKEKQRQEKLKQGKLDKLTKMKDKIKQLPSRFAIPEKYHDKLAKIIYDEYREFGGTPTTRDIVEIADASGIPFSADK